MAHAINQFYCTHFSDVPTKRKHSSAGALDTVFMHSHSERLQMQNISITSALPKKKKSPKDVF